MLKTKFLSPFILLILLPFSIAQAEVKFRNDQGKNADGGIREAAFTLYLTSSLGLPIYYTLDSSLPDPTNPAHHYQGPITVNDTTVVRACEEGFCSPERLPQYLKTRTFIFPNTLANHKIYNGMGTILGSLGTQLDYFTSELNAEALRSFESFLTISVVSKDLRQAAHSNVVVEKEKERFVSFELFDPLNKDNHEQINCDGQFFGSGSQSFPKNSLRFYFRTTSSSGAVYGEENSKLKTNPFSQWGTLAPAKKFDQIILHSGAHDSLFFNTPGMGKYVTNAWMQQTFMEMGHLGIHSRWAHLFLNGEYWGLYALMERPTASYQSSYLGFDKENYSVVKGDCFASPECNGNIGPIGATEDSARNMQTWFDMENSLSNKRLSSEYVDYENFIDYIILNYYGANDDWFGYHNWMAATSVDYRNGPYRFFPWDNDFSLDFMDNSPTWTISRSRLGPPLFGPQRNGGPAIFDALMSNNSEFNLKFMDRLYHHLSTKGALNTAGAQNRFYALTQQIRSALVLEYARWKVYPNINNVKLDYENLVNVKWPAAINEFIGKRKLRLLEDIKTFFSRQFPNAGILYIDPPQFTHTGNTLKFLSVPSGVQLHVSFDGQDPRLPLGFSRLEKMLASSVFLAVAQNSYPIGKYTHLKARYYDPIQRKWSPLLEEILISENSMRKATFRDLAITKIYHHPLQKNRLEFFEIQNTSNDTLDLGNLMITGSIQLTLRPGTTLGPYKKLIFSRNTIRYRELRSVSYLFPQDNESELYPISWLGSLSEDSKGDPVSNFSIELIEASDPQNIQLLLRFYYWASEGWPSSVNGEGAYLSLKNSISVLNDSVDARIAYYQDKNNWEALPLYVSVTPDLLSQFLTQEINGREIIHRVILPKSFSNALKYFDLERSTDLMTWKLEPYVFSEGPNAFSLEVKPPILPGSSRNFFRIRARGW